MYGNKKSNVLRKPADYIIMRNEYTLDLLPSPLFSVDILDSQISANGISLVQCWHGNSHMIHITSLDKFIWRG